jgi:hypothetical protein
LRIDFDKLVADYGRMMFENLRGFSVGVEFLETWVPSDDVTESMELLVEAATEGRLEGLEIELGAEATDRLDEARLRSAVENHGASMSVSRLGSGCVVIVSFGDTGLGRRPDGFSEVDLRYRVALQNAARMLEFEGAFPEPMGAISSVKESGKGGVTLHARFNVADNTIVELRHQGAETVAVAALFDRLCAGGKGVPIQELADHGVIGLEANLRDKSIGPGRQGIILAERTDPLFARANSLARVLARDYRNSCGIGSQENFYDKPVGAHWQSLDAPRRAEVVLATLASHASEIGITREQIEVLDTTTDTRVIVGLASSIERCRAPVVLRGAEQVIQREIDPRLELLLTERKDESVLRRLSALERK